MLRARLNQPAKLIFAGLFLVLPGLLQAATESGEATRHPVGLLGPDGSQPRVVVRDEEFAPANAMVPGERIVLTTVGTEHEWNGETEFHPLISVLVDKTFEEAPDGEWLAVWNLGHKSPGLLSRLRATIPGFTANKKVSRRELRGLEKKLEKVAERAKKKRLKTPQPQLTAPSQNRRSTISLILSGIKTGLGWVDNFLPAFDEISFPVQMFYRSYLHRRTDFLEREFEQTYLGLTWYSDKMIHDPGSGSLSPEAATEIKFRLLSNRHILGRWVFDSERDDFVHGFESEMRDHLWGTSCFLASAANEYRLAYEELHRVTEGDVPLALGGIIYYDPKLAPEPDQVHWTNFNPFDLAYNPFENREVQEAAGDGSRVPLAVYVYQSNMALKPIIVLDFFSPENPRVREAATYWRRVGNDALSVAENIGILYTLLNRALNFVPNRKGYTWFADSKLALGVDELRFSLLSHLYFEPDEAQEMLDQLDRLLVNPLVQPGRIQQVRAQVHYQTLVANQGAAAVHKARQLREKMIRQSLGKQKSGPDRYAHYRAELTTRAHLKRLEVFFADEFAPSIPAFELKESVRALAASAGESEPVVDALMRFRTYVEENPGALGRSISAELRGEIDATLGRVYLASGRSQEDFQADLELVAQSQKEEALQDELDWQNQQAGQFSKQLKLRVELLEGLAESRGDLRKYSPWYVQDALDFLNTVPAAMALNPKAVEIYQKQQPRVTAVLARLETELASSDNREEPDWIAQERRVCLRFVQDARATLRAALDAEEKPQAAVKTSFEEGGNQ